MLGTGSIEIKKKKSKILSPYKAYIPVLGERSERDKEVCIRLISKQVRDIRFMSISANLNAVIWEAFFLHTHTHTKFLYKEWNELSKVLKDIRVYAQAEETTIMRALSQGRPGEFKKNKKTTVFGTEE